MRVLFLGTSSAKPTRSRNVTAVCLQHETATWLFDCGEATQHQLMRAKIEYGRSVKRNNLDRVFITHLHGDHVYGLPGILNDRFFARNEESRDGIMHVYGPQGLAAYVRSVLALTTTWGWLNDKVVVHEFAWEATKSANRGVGASLLNAWTANRFATDTETQIKHGKATTIYEDEDYRVEVAPIQHTVPCVGYVVNEKPRPGQMIVERLEEANITRGPVWRYIKEGMIDTLPNGMKAKDFLGPSRAGRKLVILGDTSDPSSIKDAALNCDLLIHEATFAAGDERAAKDHGHSTARMAGKFAKLVQAQHLVVSHFGSTFSSTPDGGDKAAKEAKAEFAGPVTAALEFMEISLGRSKSEEIGKSEIQVQPPVRLPMPNTVEDIDDD